MRLWVYFIGKPRDEHANAIAGEYVKRTSRWVEIGMREIDPKRFDLFARHASARKILLDPEGTVVDSAAFAALLEEAGRLGRDLVFVLGGHDGLPPEWKRRADLLLSLSALTFPHELARAMLAEQLYRGFATLRGHPYPR